MVRELLTASLLATPPIASAPPEITVLVFNYGNSPGSMIEAAKSEVSAIYAKAGLVIRWRNCVGLTEAEPACDDNLNAIGSVIALRIVPDLAIDPRDKQRNSSNVLGFSTGVYTTVSYERSWKVSVDTGEERAHVLACAIAHEIGHVLLGRNSHSHLGLMQANAPAMLRATRQGFWFTDAESKRLLAYIAAHHRPHPDLATAIHP